LTKSERESVIEFINSLWNSQIIVRYSTLVRICRFILFQLPAHKPSKV
jgi:hypothetical protein